MGIIKKNESKRQQNTAGSISPQPIPMGSQLLSKISEITFSSGILKNHEEAPASSLQVLKNLPSGNEANHTPPIAFIKKKETSASTENARSVKKEIIEESTCKHNNFVDKENDGNSEIVKIEKKLKNLVIHRSESYNSDGENDSKSVSTDLSDELNKLHLSQDTLKKEDAVEEEENTLIARGPERRTTNTRWGNAPYGTARIERNVALQIGGGIVGGENFLQGVTRPSDDCIPGQFLTSNDGLEFYKATLQAVNIEPLKELRDIIDDILYDPIAATLTDSTDSDSVNLSSPGSYSSSLSLASIQSPRSVDSDNQNLNISGSSSPQSVVSDYGYSSPGSNYGRSVTPIMVQHHQSDFISNSSTEPNYQQTLSSQNVNLVLQIKSKIENKINNLDMPLHSRQPILTYETNSSTRHCAKISSMGNAIYDKPESAIDRMGAIIKSKIQRERLKYNVEASRLIENIKHNPTVFKSSFSDTLKKQTITDEKHWLLRIYAHLEYWKKSLSLSKTLSLDDGHYFLEMACNNHADTPIAARLILEVMLGLYINNEKKLNSLAIELVCRGDSHIEQIAELFSIRKENKERVFNIDCTNVEDQTLLHLAIIRSIQNTSYITTIKYLIDRGAKLLQDNAGMTPLHYSVFEGVDCRIFDLLLRSNQLTLDRSIVDQQDHRGNTALHYACEAVVNDQRKIPVIDTLLKELKVNSKIKNKKDETPKIPDQFLKKSRG